MHTAEDRAHMARALKLARKGLYTTTPNPRVGCVLVRDGVVIGEGWHQRAGEAHAEIKAMASATSPVKGATAYVPLEPCSHHGRTPPCAEALVRAGVARVVAAMSDPNPQVAGSGIEFLRAAGVDAQVGLMEDEARQLNCGFVSRMTAGRPWIRTKIAASLDGRTALANGRSQWITGAAARRDGHRWRARACAILTGSGTVRADDPTLTVREVKTGRQPLRVVVDSRLETPLDARIAATGTLIFTAGGNEERRALLAGRGVELVTAAGDDGRVDLAVLTRMLADRGINELHVEAGPALNGALLAAGLIDELVMYYAPSVLGSGAKGMFGMIDLEDLSGKTTVRITDVRRVGDDLRVIARVGGR